MLNHDLLKSKLGPLLKPCLLCSGNDWGISDSLVTWPCHDGNKTVFPVVTVVCSKCFNVLTYAAQPLGIIPAGIFTPQENNVL